MNGIDQFLKQLASILPMAKINGKGQARTYRSIDELIEVTNEMSKPTAAIVLLSYHCCSRVGHPVAN